MEELKKYLERHTINYRPVEEWSLIFGNHPDGVYIPAEKAPVNYIKKLGLHWEYRGHYTAVYVAPKKRKPLHQQPTNTRPIRPGRENNARGDHAS